MGDFTCTHTHTDTQAYRAISSPKWQLGSCLTAIDMPRGAQVNIGSVFFCLLFGYRLWLSQFFPHLQSQHSLWDGNCSSHMKTLSCVFNCCIWETCMTMPARTVTPPHTRSDTSSVFWALMRMKLHFLAVIVDVYFCSFVSKDYVCETHGPADCFECLSTLYDCAVPQVLNKAAPLECSKRVSIVA